MLLKASRLRCLLSGPRAFDPQVALMIERVGELSMVDGFDSLVAGGVDWRESASRLRSVASASRMFCGTCRAATDGGKGKER